MPARLPTARLPRVTPARCAALALGAALILGPALGPAAHGALAAGGERVALHASFNPDRLRTSTTIAFGFTIAREDGGVPSPLRGVDLHLPAGLGLARNTLGTATCEAHYLEVLGPEGCPANSQVGYGSALAEVPYGPIAVREAAFVYAYRGETEHEHLTILFLAEGRSPVWADLVFPGQILEDSPPFSGRIETEVPPVPSLPEAPYVSVASFQSTFGPQGLTYERKVGHRTIHFHPRGVTVPPTCPRGGYPFAADFSFEDGTHLTAQTTAPCASKGPAGRRRGARRGH